MGGYPGGGLAGLAVVCDSASSTARFAARFEEMREAVFDQFVEMVESRIYTLLREDTSIQRQAEPASTDGADGAHDRVPTTPDAKGLPAQVAPRPSSVPDRSVRPTQEGPPPT